MTAPHELGARFRHHRAHCRPHQSAVHALGDFRNAGGRSEGKVVLGAIAADLTNVVEFAGLETEQVVALHQLGIFDRFVDTRDHRLVKPGRHQIDHVHRIGKFLVLLRRHLSRDEDAEMPNALMQAIDDRLAGFDDLVLVIIEVENPVERLLRRRDVVAPGAEHDDRRFDVAQVDTRTV